MATLMISSFKKQLLWLMLVPLLVGGWSSTIAFSNSLAPQFAPKNQVPDTVNLVISAEILGLDPSGTTYSATVTVSDPIYVRDLVVIVEDVELGNRVYDNRVSLRNERQLTILFPTTGMRDGAEYLLKISAEDVQGNLLTRAEEFGSGQDDPTIFATDQFKYVVPKAPEVSILIETVTAEFEANRLEIIWDVSDPNRVEQYYGFIEDEGGQRIQDIPRMVFDPLSNGFTTELPSVMTDPATASSYLLNLKFVTDDDEEIAVIEEFIANPPPRPGLIRRILSTFTSSTNTLVAILFVVLTLMVWRMMQGDKKPKKQKLKAPPTHHTRQYPTVQSIATGPSEDVDQKWAKPAKPRTPTPPPAPPAKPRLRFAVIESPSPAMTGMERIIDSYPVMIGRTDSDIVLRDDSQISRQHAQIVYENDRLYLMDLGSTNGTYINRQALNANQRVPLSGTKRVWFGRNTECEIELL